MRIFFYLGGSRLSAMVLGVALMALCPSNTWGVVVSTTQETTTRPIDDPGWNNVGIVRGSTGIYLGDRWMLTAAHVGLGSVNFPELGVFAAESGSGIQITNRPGSGLTKPADLLLFRLVDDPGLPPIKIGQSSPALGDEVLVIGNGLSRLDEPTYWDVSQRGAVWTWTETSTPSDYEGYGTTGPQIIRWGTNLIEDDETFVNEFDDDIVAKLRQSTTDTFTILTEFDRDDSTSDEEVLGSDGSSATLYESQAVLSDSGGGMFLKRNGQWELVGTILAVDGHRNQPDVKRNAIYGNITYYADLASYLPEIEKHVIFGDFDGNLSLDVTDLDAMAVAMNGAFDARFDLDRDEQLSFNDRRIWVEDLLGTFFGDADLDGEFGTSDLIQVLQAGEYEDSLVGNSTWATGDWNGDLEFTTNDFVVALQSGFFEQGPRVPTSTVSSVPEPSVSVVALLITAALGCLQTRRAGRCRS